MCDIQRYMGFWCHIKIFHAICSGALLILVEWICFNCPAGYLIANQVKKTEIAPSWESLQRKGAINRAGHLSGEQMPGFNFNF
jgi:hypothetical protein